MIDTTYSTPLAHTYLDRQIIDGHHRAIIANLLSTFGVAAGDQVIEIGAGSGRWTRVLLEHGLRVIAYEPDPALGAKIDQKMRDDPKLTVMEAGVQEMNVECDVRIVCGFHVLHHLNQECLSALKERLAILSTKPNFAGWFFLEPNAANPLYALQILLTPAMSFREESGIWSNNYQEMLGTPGQRVLLGTIGLFPPHPMVGKLPQSLQHKFTTLHAGRSPVRSYSVFGGLVKSRDPC